MYRNVTKRFLIFAFTGILAFNCVSLTYSKARNVSAFAAAVPLIAGYEVVSSLFGILGISLGGIAYLENKETINQAVMDYAEYTYNLQADIANQEGDAMQEFGEFLGDAISKGHVIITDNVRSWLHNMAQDFNLSKLLSYISSYGVDISPNELLPEYSLADGVKERVFLGLTDFGDSSTKSTIKKYDFLTSKKDKAVSFVFSGYEDGDRIIGYFLYPISKLEDGIKLRYNGSTLLAEAVTGGGLYSYRNLETGKGTVMTGLGSTSSLYFSTNFQDVCLYLNPDLLQYYDLPSVLGGLGEEVIDFDPLGQIQEKLKELGKGIDSLNFGSVLDGAFTNAIPVIDSSIWEQVYEGVLTWQDVMEDFKVSIWDMVDNIPIVGELPNPVEPEPAPEEPIPTPTPPSALDGYILDGLTDVFPFCLPFDFIDFIDVLSAEPQAPKFTLPIPVPDGKGGFNMDGIEVDFSQFDYLARIFRLGETLVFIVGLILVTRQKMIRG